MSALAEAEQEVLARLEDDFEFYATNCLKIVDKSGSLVPFEMNDAQQELDALLREQRGAGKRQMALALKARRVGVSTYAQGRLIHRTTLRANHSAMVVAHDLETGGILFDMGQTMYVNLPDEGPLKPPLKRHRTERFLHFANPDLDAWKTGDVGLNSRYRVNTANEFGGGRGGGFLSFHGSEVAHWAAIAQKLAAVLPTVPNIPEALVLLETTANGMNEFKDLWDAAEKGETDWIAFFWPWWKQTDYALPFFDERHREEFAQEVGQGRYGEDEPWLLEQRWTTRDGAEHQVTLEQLHWRRRTIVTEYAGDLTLFRQEYPACLTGEMRVSTEHGMIPIGEAGDSAETESGPIKRWGAQSPSQIYKVTTCDGRVLRGTHDHPVQTPDGLIGLSRLEPGVRVALRSPRFAEERYVEKWTGRFGSRHEIPITPDLGRFIGYFMGDGSWSRGCTSVVCDARDEDVVEDVASLLERFVSPPSRRLIARVQGRRGATELRSNCVAAREFYDRLGMVGVNGSGGWRREVCVPECIFRSPRPVVRQFLRGLFEADGSASANKVRWASSKPHFARDVQLLLLGFGISAPIAKQEKTAGSGAKYVSYTIGLNVADSRRFHDEIGFVGARKRKARPPAQKTGRPSRPREMWDEVASVEKDGVEVTYDFTLDTKDHLFAAQGVLTHNTAEEAFIGSGNRVFDTEAVKVVISKAVAPRATGKLEARKKSEKVGRVGSIMVPEDPFFVPREEMEVGVTAPWSFWLHRNAAGELVVPESQYVIGVDVSGGEVEAENAEPAFHAIEIVDHFTGEQVAEYSSRIDPHLLTREVYLAALLFRNAWVAIEKTGSWGQPLVHTLWFDYHYPFVYRRRKHGTTQEKTEKLLGWETSPRTKPILLTRGQELIGTDSHGIKSRELAGEALTYIRNDKGKTMPEPGKFSDRLMAWLIAQQVRSELPPRTDEGDEAVQMWAPRDPRSGY